MFLNISIIPCCETFTTNNMGSISCFVSCTLYFRSFFIMLFMLSSRHLYKLTSDHFIHLEVIQELTKGHSIFFSGKRFNDIQRVQYQEQKIPSEVKPYYSKFSSPLHSEQFHWESPIVKKLPSTPVPTKKKRKVLLSNFATDSFWLSFRVSPTQSVFPRGPLPLPQWEKRSSILPRWSDLPSRAGTNDKNSMKYKIFIVNGKIKEATLARRKRGCVRDRSRFFHLSSLQQRRAPRCENRAYRQWQV